MKLSKQVKENIYSKIIKAHDIKNAHQIGKELQDEIDKEQPLWFVEWYKSTLEKATGQKLNFYTYVSVTIGYSSVSLWVEVDFLKSKRCKALIDKARSTADEIIRDLKNLKDTILSVDTDKAFLIIFPQWESQLLESLPPRKAGLPATPADVSYLDKYKPKK